jgi:hypothetical protein
MSARARARDDGASERPPIDVHILWRFVLLPLLRRIGLGGAADAGVILLPAQRAGSSRDHLRGHEGATFATADAMTLKNHQMTTTKKISHDNNAAPPLLRAAVAAGATPARCAPARRAAPRRPLEARACPSLRLVGHFSLRR